MIASEERQRSWIPVAAHYQRILIRTISPDEGVEGMRTLNLKFLAGLTVSGVVLGAGVIGLHELQAGRSAGWLLKKAGAAEKKGDLSRARSHLERYLAYKPKDIDALARYGQLLDETAKSPRERLKALLTLEQVLRREPTRQHLRRRIVDLDLDLERPTDAKWHLEILRKNKPDDGELEHLTARAILAERTYADAVPWYEKAIEHAPGRIKAFEELADLFRSRLNKPTQADAIMDRLVRENDRSAQAYISRWRYRKAHHLDDADEDAAKAETLAPDDPDVILAVASEAIDRREVEKARSALSRGEALAPLETRIYQARAALEREDGQLDDAVAALKRGIGKSPDDSIMLHWDLVNLLIDLGRHDAAAQALAEIERNSLAQALGNYVRARLPMAARHWALAQKELEKARPAIADVPDWSNHLARLDLDLALCADRLGNPDQRITALRRVVEASSENVGVRRLLAESLASSGQIDQAILEYERIVARDPDSWPALARLLLNRTLREQPDHRNWTALDQALARANLARPESVEIAILRAEALTVRGHIDEARDLLETTRKAHPDWVEPWVSLALLNRRLDDREGASRLLDEAQERLGDHVELALARLLIAMADPEDTRRRQQVDALEAEREQFDQADRRTLGIALANAYNRLGQDAETDRIWDRLARENPDDLEIRLARLDRALRSGDKPAIESALAEVRRIEGQGGDMGAFGEARWLILKARKGNTKAVTQARALLERLAQRRPDWPPLVLARAEADDLAGYRDQAMDGYLKAFNLGLRNTEICRRAAELLTSARRFDEADRLIRALEEQVPLTGDLRRLAGGLALQQHDEGRALETARKAVEEGSKDSKDHLWLARVLWAVDRKNEVEPVLRQAMALAPGGPNRDWP